MTAPDKGRRPPRVIHVVESLDVGAVETWLLRMLRAGRTFGTELDWTFYSVLSRPGRYDDVARELGATVLHSPVELDDKWAFIGSMRRALRAGRYDVLHCHHDLVSAVYLASGTGLGIPRTVVHVHNADMHVPTGSPRKAALLREPMRRLCLAMADRIVGISRHTLETFLHGEPPSPPRDVVLYYGIDTAAFRAPRPDRAELRRSIGLPDDARILLFVGRMVSYKNPAFVVDILGRLAVDDPNVFAVFAGSGPLEDEVQSHARAVGVEDRVRVLGWRDDTVRLMQVSDAFVFPRLEDAPDVGMEGLGLVVVEAQAAGLRSLLSGGIPDDAIVLPELCDTLPLSAGSDAWASVVRVILARPQADPERAFEAIGRSEFSLEAGFRGLTALHQI